MIRDAELLAARGRERTRSQLNISRARDADVELSTKAPLGPRMRLVEVPGSRTSYRGIGGHLFQETGITRKLSSCAY